MFVFVCLCLCVCAKFVCCVHLGHICAFIKPCAPTQPPLHVGVLTHMARVADMRVQSRPRVPVAERTPEFDLHKHTETLCLLKGQIGDGLYGKRQQLARYETRA